MGDDPFLEPYRDIAGLRARALEILGLAAGATRDEIRVAFRGLARRHHPDVGGSAPRFTRVVNAYLVLTRPDPRGFPLEQEPPGPLGVPESPEEYRRWWLDRFFP